jgi:hypothetical protein
MCGRLPGEKIKSLTRVEARSIAESKVAAGIAVLDAVGTGVEIFAGIFRMLSSLQLWFQLTLSRERSQVTKVVVLLAWVYL